MKIKVMRSNFLDGLKKVQNIVGAKGSLQILQNVLMTASDNHVELTTTDLDISIRSLVSCEVEVEGSTTLPVKMLFNTCSKLPDGPILIDVDAENRAVITASSATFKITGMSPVDFPKLPDNSDAFAYVLPQNTLREMLRKTHYAASQEESRKTLRGVLASFKNGKLTNAATDGRRLAVIEYELDFPATAERDIIMPMKLVTELMHSLGTEGEVRIIIDNSQVSFDCGMTRIYSKLVDEIYPNYRQVIPTSCNQHVIVERKLLIDALDRASVMMVEESSSTRLIFDSNQLSVTSTAKEAGGEARDIVPIKYDGPRIEISFNPAFLMEPLKAIDDDEVALDLCDSITPAILRCSMPFLYVMMPLRVN